VISLASIHFLALLGLTATAWVAGRTATRRLALEESWTRFGIDVALGLSILAYAGLLLGSIHLLTPGLLIALALLIHLLGIGVWRELAREVRERWRRGGGWWIGLAATAALAPLFVLALYPPLAFDETSYHLPVAAGFARVGGVPFLPELRFPVFPHLANVLFAEVLLLAGDTEIHLVELLAAGSTAALLVGWGRSLSRPVAGWMAASLFLGYPIVAYLSGTGYVDAGFALFVTAGLFAMERWRKSRQDAWLVLGMVFLASAAGTKYHGLVFMAAALVLAGLGAPRGRRGRALLLALVVGLAALAPWYGRILYYTGDPLFPSGFSRSSPWGMDLLGPSLRERLAALPALPWDVLFRRGRLGQQPPYSPAFLLGLPLLAAGAVRDGRVRRLVTVCAVYLLVIVLVSPLDARYFVALLPVLSLALAMELEHWADRLLGDRWRRLPLSAALCALFLLPGWLYAVYRIYALGPVPATVEERDRFLSGQLPAYPAIRFLNRRSGSGSALYAFHAERMRFFAEGRFLGDWNGPAAYGRFLPLVRDPRALHRALREVGAGHLLVVEGTGVVLPVDDPAFRARFQRVYSDGFSEVYELRPAPESGSPASGPDRTPPRGGRAGPA
jgi:hypothetical protein